MQCHPLVSSKTPGLSMHTAGGPEHKYRTPRCTGGGDDKYGDRLIIQAGLIPSHILVPWDAFHDPQTRFSTL